MTTQQQTDRATSIVEWLDKAISDDQGRLERIAGPTWNAILVGRISGFEEVRDLLSRMGAAVRKESLQTAEPLRHRPDCASEKTRLTLQPNPCDCGAGGPVAEGAIAELGELARSLWSQACIDAISNPIPSPDPVWSNIARAVLGRWLAMEAARPKAGQAFVVTEEIVAEIAAAWPRSGNPAGFHEYLACRLTELAAEHARGQRLDGELNLASGLIGPNPSDGEIYTKAGKGGAAMISAQAARIAELEAELASAQAAQEHNSKRQKELETAIDFATRNRDTFRNLQLKAERDGEKYLIERDAAQAELTALKAQRSEREPSEAEVEAAAREILFMSPGNLRTDLPYLTPEAQRKYRETAARALRAANAVRPPAAIRQVTAQFKKEQYGATVLTVLETDNSIVEVKECPGKTYELTIHARYEDRERWEDISAHLTAEQFGTLGAVAHRMLAEPAVLATQGEQG